MSTENELQNAIERAEKSGTTAQRANALADLAEHYHRQEQFSEAAPVYERALAAWREILGPEHPAVGSLLVNLGQIYLFLDDLSRGQSILRQALTIAETDVDFDDTDAVAAFGRLVERLRMAGRPEEARRIDERVKRVAERVQALVYA